MQKSTVHVLLNVGLFVVDAAIGLRFASDELWSSSFANSGGAVRAHRVRIRGEDHTRKKAGSPVTEK